MQPQPLAVAATRERLHDLLEADVLTPDAHRRALELVAESPAPDAWKRFSARAALILGSLLCLAGVVFFIAHNWDGMTRWARFGLIEAGLLACAVAAVRARAELPRQMALTLAAALLGPLLAVYGQTYQTGADPYELFLTWALLAAPLAALARFAPLWLGVWALLNLSLQLFCWQVHPPHDGNWPYVALAEAGLNVAGFIAYELISKRTSRLGPPVRYVPRTLGTLAVLVLVPSACWYLLGDEWFFHSGNWGAASAVALAALSVAFAVVYSRPRADRFLMGLTAFGGCALATAAVMGRLEHLLRNGTVVWAALGAFIVLEVTLAASWIRRAPLSEATS